MALTAWGRRWRWRLGKGWDEADFAARYRGGGDDAWGYRRSAAHAERAEAIMAALPRPRFRRALEVGCAQGFLSERLAARCDRVVACDLSEAALAGARAACADLSNIEFRRADIRAGFPGETFDLALFSDVLYYLSPREIDAVLGEAERRVETGGYLVVANEWTGAGGLTSPEYALARLERDGSAWARVARGDRDLGEARLFLGAYQLRERGEEMKPGEG